MADEYDKEAALLVCAIDVPVDKTRDRVAAALREAFKRRAELQRELNRISEEIGLPPGIGPAEGWLKNQLEGYNIALMERDELRREVERLTNLIGIIQRESLNDLDLISKFNAEIAALKAQVGRLKNLLRYAAPSVDHLTCPSYPECKRCEIERMLEAK